MLVHLIAEDLWLWVYGLWFMVYLYYLCLFTSIQSVMRLFVCGYDVDMYCGYVLHGLWAYRRQVLDITLISCMLKKNLDVAAYI